MMKKLPLLLLAASCLMLTVSCATTSLTDVWINHAYEEGPISNILIVGVIEPQRLRKQFEDEMVLQLKGNVTKGVPSYSVFPDETMPEKEEIASKIKEMGMDSVLIARLVDIRDLDLHETYPPFVSYGGYYALCCQNIISSGYHIRFETKIFAAQKDELIWSASSETLLERAPENITSSFITAILKDLRIRNLIQ